MAYVKYHPVYLDLNGRHVLIVGGGSIAEEKLRSLMLSGARITVVAPDASETIKAWFEANLLTWIPRRFRDDDIEPAYMVIAATEDPEVNARVYSCGNSRNRLTNSVDDPANCNFIMAAIVRKGPMQVAVSSAGCSPALAQRVRSRIANEILTGEVGELAEFLGERRGIVKSRLPGYKVRQAFWERIIAGRIPGLLASDRRQDAESHFLEMLERAIDAAPGEFAAETGKVALVGAGPGDPELITLKGLTALRNADAVLYDRLIDTKLLDHCPPHCTKIYAGKDVGKGRTGRQGRINRTLIELASRGEFVVRLKGGDPFVFGRGGEEVLALHAAGITYEVIPGVTSAIAGPAAAGIPVTHRRVSTSFAVFAGREADASDGIPWDAAARMDTAVFLMGVERLASIVGRLIGAGSHPSTPVAIISNATYSNQVVVSGTLESIVKEAAGVASPAVIVVGDVVRVREKLAKAPDSSTDCASGSLEASLTSL